MMRLCNKIINVLTEGIGSQITYEYKKISAVATPRLSYNLGLMFYNIIIKDEDITQ